MYATDQEQYQNIMCLPQTILVIVVTTNLCNIKLIVCHYFSAVSSAVTSISCHPHFSKYFLVGFTTGHIGLFHLHWSHPLITWPPRQNNQPIREVCWHLDWPSVFVCVSGDQDVHIWYV